MLQVVRPTGVGSIFAVRNQYYIGALNVEVTPNVYEVFNPAYYLFPSFDESYSIKGDIVTTPSNILEGENVCHHVNITGCITPSSQFVPLSIGASPKILTTYDTPRGKMSFSMPLTCYPIIGPNYTHVLDFRTPVYHHRSFHSVWFDGFGHEYPGIAHIYYSNRVFARYNVITYGFTTMNSYSSQRETICGQMSVEYDALRGIRYKYLASDSWVPRVFADTHALEQYMDNIYFGYWPLSGAYSWTKSMVTRTGISNSGLGLLGDIRIADNIHRNARAYLPTEYPNLGEMSYDCVSQIGLYEGNGLALMHDLITLKKQVTSVISLLRNWKNPKSWASLFLSTKYGVPLTISDMKVLLQSIQEGLSRLPNAKVSSSRSWLSGYCIYESHYSIYYAYPGRYLSDLNSFIEEFHLIPDYSDLWDFIPFSFVVNWFVNIGAFLEKMDVIEDYSEYDIQGCIFSLKVLRNTTPAKLGFPGYDGNIVITKYDRIITDSACPPSIARSTITPPTFDHWIEGAALIAQKIFN